MRILSNARTLVSGLAVATLAATAVGIAAAPAEAAPLSAWDRVAQCESGGNWHINTGNGYYGGLQFSMGTWRGHGGSGNPAAASKSTQIKIAERVLASQGWGAWPVCSRKAGVYGTATVTAADHVAKQSTSTSSSGAKHVKREAKHAAIRTSGTVTVRSGDTLAGIAARHHVSGGWKRLWSANPQLDDADVIHVGQVLHLPA